MSSIPLPAVGSQIATWWNRFNVWRDEDVRQNKRQWRVQFLRRSSWTLDAVSSVWSTGQRMDKSSRGRQTVDITVKDNDSETTGAINIVTMDEEGVVCRARLKSQAKHPRRSFNHTATPKQRSEAPRASAKSRSSIQGSNPSRKQSNCNRSSHKRVQPS